MHHHHDHGYYDEHASHHEYSADHLDFSSPNDNHTHTGHHHHGDDRSTLHHQHNTPADHFHIVGLDHDDFNDDTYEFGAADHNHDQPTDAFDHPAEHVHYWRRTGLILSGNYHYTGFNTYTTERDIVAADSSAQT